MSELFPRDGADWGVLVSAGSSAVAVLAMGWMAASAALRRADRRRRPRGPA